MVVSGQPLIRRAWGALATLSCATFVIGPVVSSIPEWSAEAPRSLFDVGPEPTAVTPMPAAAMPLAGWRFEARSGGSSWGVIDITGCSEAQIYYALAAMPVVTDRFSTLAPRDGFLSVDHVDYGSLPVADHRLFPIRHPATECMGQAAAVFSPVEQLPIDPIDGVDVVAYRVGSGEGFTAVIADETGRAALVTGARVTDDEVRELVVQITTQLRSSTG